MKRKIILRSSALIILFTTSLLFFTSQAYAADPIPLYRLYNGLDHFYTTSTAERDTCIASGWLYEGNTSYVWSKNSSESGTVPLYRLWNGADHLYTTSEVERNNLRNSGWRDENVACRVYPSQTSYTVPLYRLYNIYNGDHLYTTSNLEISLITSPFGSYVVEGGKPYCYVRPMYADNFGAHYLKSKYWAETNSIYEAQIAQNRQEWMGYHAYVWSGDNNNPDSNNANFARTMMRRDAIFNFNGHSNKGFLAFVDYTDLWSGEIVSTSGLDDMLFAAYIGCYTAGTDDYGRNLLVASRYAGIDSVMGFRDAVYDAASGKGPMDIFCEHFWNFVATGQTVGQAAENAVSEVRKAYWYYDFRAYGFDSYEFDGASANPAGVKLTPAHYGRRDL